MKISCLNLMGCYWPCHDATGPNQSLRAMMHGLKNDVAFSVIAKQSPDEKTENNISSSWEYDGYCRTQRLPVNRITSIGLGALLRETPHDILMCNGFFDAEFTINTLVQRRLGKIPRKPVIVSPRGEFAPSALSFGSAKKKAYIRFGKSIGLFNDVWFHATAEHEVVAIQNAELGGRGILTAPNPAKWFDLPSQSLNAPNSEKLNLAFLGRITPVKNIPYALEALAKVKHPVRYHIFGPIEDQAHWDKCESLIKALPDHVEVVHQGLIANDKVPEIFSEYDALFLPTQGENFGHAIHESLMSGIPVIISDQTPWQNLASHSAGWDLPLNGTDLFSETIDQLAKMSPLARKALREGARQFAEKRWHESGAIEATKIMFNTVLDIQS